MMRREGYELMVGKPEILTRKVDGTIQEPVEHLAIDCPESCLPLVAEHSDGAGTALPTARSIGALAGNCQRRAFPPAVTIGIARYSARDG
jgi:hypothetical protein